MTEPKQLPCNAWTVVSGVALVMAAVHAIFSRGQLTFRDLGSLINCPSVRMILSRGAPRAHREGDFVEPLVRPLTQKDQRLGIALAGRYG
jgi:hypothetical protein